MEENYYWTDDLSDEFYIKAAQCGFITTSMYKNNDFFLLPEIQFDYAILDFKDIIIPKHVLKIIRKNNFTFSINNSFEEVCERIKKYHDKSWMNDDYIKILKSIKSKENKYKDFKLLSIELREKETNRLIAGEVGYESYKIYTSLSGFITKEKKFNNWGKVQIVLLNHYLENNSYKFWNLGHPQLQYKIDLGAKIYNRKNFLKKLNNY